ncbi:MAG: rRNA maturation RNase YbeY [Deltaproteobacteria bacterium]|nr:rRNA maturation RNase YbeY [Deltaproteobacteria bacterium]
MGVSVTASCGVKADRKKIKRVLDKALKYLGLGGKEVSVLITGNAGIRELNRKYRGCDRPTDVLSFPMDDETLLGDIVISQEKAALQAREFHVGLDEETSRLLIHGLLHLLGYDHVKGGRQAKRMREKEEEILRSVKRERP